MMECSKWNVEQATNEQEGVGGQSHFKGLFTHKHKQVNGGNEDVGGGGQEGD